MILHIASDEKFIDMGIAPFEAISPNCNELLLISASKSIKHVTFKNRNILTVNEVKKKSKNEFFWKDIDIVIFHSLITYDISIPKGIKVIWFGFGYDYYDLIFSDPLDAFGCKTRKIVTKKSLKENVKSLINTIILRSYLRKKKRYRLIERVDIFCPVLTTEYEAIRWPVEKKPKLMDWNYGTMEDNWAKDSVSILTGNNILLGNSAATTCNHIEAIDLLSQASELDSSLIIPLSYGNTRKVKVNYSQVVKEYAVANYIGEVIPLEDFMNFDDYMKVISSCSFVIMPHKRQQGLGNILMLMNLGAKVFLDEQNSLYTFLKANGFYVFTLEDIKTTHFQQALTEYQVSENRKLLFNMWGRSSIVDKSKQLIECKIK